MPERNHEVVIDGYVFPDTVTVTLVNDEYTDSRDYVGKELYESVCGANDAWQSENAKLRELVKAMKPFLCCMPFASCNTLAANIRNRMRELGVE